MRYGILTGLLVLLCTGTLSANFEQAANEGQADLDKATEAKLTANTISDLGEVIRLCESAMQKGLDESGTQLAKQLLASSRIVRGTAIAKLIFGTLPPDPNWAKFRQLALEDLEKAVQLTPDQPQALFLIARLNLLLPGGDVARGKTALDEAIQKGGDDPPTRAKALLLRAELSDDQKKKMADLDEAVRTSPGDALMLRARGEAYSGMGEHEKALADFDAALKLQPDDVGILEARALELIDLEKYDDALASLEKVRQHAPDSAAPLFQRARIRALQGDFQAAIADLNDAAQREPENLAVLLLRATVYQELKEPEKAMADVDQALKLKPGLPTAMRIRAMLLAGSGKLKEAITQLEALGKEAAKDQQVSLQLALLYSAEKHLRQAVEKFSEVLAADPTSQIAWQGRADALLSMGKQTEAVADYEKALQLDPKDSSVLNNLAWVLCTSPDDKLRDGKRAIELATQACKVTDYKQAHILSTLGAAYAETGDFKTAMQWSEKAIALGSEDQKEALEKELESYKAGKPIREIQNEPEEPKEEPKAEQPKTEEPKTEEPKTEEPPAKNE